MIADKREQETGVKGRIAIIEKCDNAKNEKEKQGDINDGNKRKNMIEIETDHRRGSQQYMIPGWVKSYIPGNRIGEQVPLQDLEYFPLEIGDIGMIGIKRESMVDDLADDDKHEEREAYFPPVSPEERRILRPVIIVTVHYLSMLILNKKVRSLKAPDPQIYESAIS
jgi:hypothetical protein